MGKEHLTFQEQIPKQRVSTGIPGLDTVMRGGIPVGASTLVIGPPGSGKSIFAKHYLVHGLISGNRSILIDTYESFDLMVEGMESFGWKEAQNIDFIDLFNWKVTPTSESIKSSNLNELNIALEKRLSMIKPGVGSRLAFDSFSEILLYNTFDVASKFLANLKAKLAQRRITNLIILEAGMHDEKAMTAIEYLTDGTIRLKADETGRFISVGRMRGTPTDPKWLPFTIKMGIELGVNEFFR